MIPEGREVRILSFDNYELDCRFGVLRRDDREIRLQPQPARLLILLATRAGELVTRVEIRKALWGDDTFVDFEHAINFSIKRIREALEESAERPRYVETVRRLGYRFIAETIGLEQPRRAPERAPYPGLPGFSEGDFEFFFGREDEVQFLWRKLERSHLLAVIGPSGAGKSSLLHAGLLPAQPPGWHTLICRPRASPFGALAQALAPRLALKRDEAGKAVPTLLHEWRRDHPEVLLGIDAFEELFTLNDESTRARFCQLLSKASEEWGVHVLLLMRDDFLIHCHDHPGLARVFSEVTPLKPPRGAALRRALVEPARKCGYQFEDEALVAELLTEVTNERGALPLLAFAAARLWEKRDQARSVLTREAYLEIGGVGGALGRHADETLAAIGQDREPIVREIFRNLTTVKGTRAPQDRREILSIFEDREAAGTVLGKLIDARLLTSFHSSEAGEALSDQQIEIIHETLLSSWPCLVRWQAQDAEGAVLRDQLRQAARAWRGRGRVADLLWTGTSFRALALWRERYTGGLTETEEAFVDASTRLAERKRRRRRLVVGALLAASVAVAAITSSLWRQAKAEALRAEAAKLLALGQSELETYPTAALAYAIKSLELTDTEVGRLFALRVLQRGPTATLTPVIARDSLGEEAVHSAFSPNGEWLAVGGWKRATLLHRSGFNRIVLGDYSRMPQFVDVSFGPGSDTLMADQFGDVRVWSIPGGRELRRGRFEEGPSEIEVGRDGFVSMTTVGQRQILRLWPFDSREPRLVGSMETWEGQGDVARGWLAYPRGREIYLRSLDDWSLPPRLFAEHEADVRSVAFSPDGERLAASDSTGEIRIWPAAVPSVRPLRVLHGRAARALRFGPGGNRLAGIVGEQPEVEVWDLLAPPGAEPVILQRTDAPYLEGLEFDPSGGWLLTTHGDAAFWTLNEKLPHVLAGLQAGAIHVAFAPDGKSLVSAGGDEVRAWPFSVESHPESRVLQNAHVSLHSPVVDSASGSIIVPDWSGNLLVIPLSGEPTRKVPACNPGCFPVALGDGGRLVATAPDIRSPVDERLIIRLFDLETGELKQTLQPPPEAREGADLPYFGYQALRFLGPDQLLASHGENGLFLFNLTDGTSRLLAPQLRGHFVLSRDKRFVVGLTGWPEGDMDRPFELVRFNLDEGVSESLSSHGTQVSAVALNPTGTLVATGSVDGTVRIGPISGEEPYVFLRHKGQVWSVAFSPDGRFLASVGDDRKILLWPLPDLSKPPLQKRPYPEVLSLLRSRTNLRAVPDNVSPTGWKLDRDPFPGWAGPGPEGARSVW